MSRTIRTPYVKEKHQYTRKDFMEDKKTVTNFHMKSITFDRYKHRITADHGSFQSPFLKNYTNRLIRRVNSRLIRTNEDPILVRKGFGVLDYGWLWF